MSQAELTNQLKSLNDACDLLQQRVVGDAKAGELLYCIRGLVTLLATNSETGEALREKARHAFGQLRADVERIAGKREESGDIFAALQMTHARLVLTGTSDAIALSKQLAKIETDYTAAFEQAFVAASKPRASVGVDAALSSFDKDKLASYLAEIFSTPHVVVDAIDVISGGFSKQTLKVTLHGGDGKLPDALILRLDLPAETAFSVTIVATEFAMLVAAWKNGAKVPHPYALEASGKVLGRPFIVLDVVPGRTLGTLFSYPPPDAGLGADIAHQMAKIHTVPESALGPDVMGPEIPTIDRIHGEIELSREHWRALGRRSTILEEGFATLERNLHLADGVRCMVHGDMALHNIMVHEGSVSAILDWEFAKMGNPADDLGYIQDTATHLMGWNNYLAAYREAGGTVPPAEQIEFYRLLSLVRICTLVSQADAAFCAGVLPQIQYAPPGSYFLRGALIKLGELVQRMR